MNLKKCILTMNDCYKTGAVIAPKGVMVHSTGANNPNLCRYVQPDDGALGRNAYGNDWNRPGKSVCVHAFIGKQKDGSIATYQTLPWNMRGWHCGGKGNDTHISFEICEDALNNKSYFQSVYQEAVELTAYLCKTYNLDPLKDGVVICHSEGAKRGIASKHADVTHWWPKFGKSMDDFRKDVKAAMGTSGTASDTPTASSEKMVSVELPLLKKGSTGSAVKNVQTLLTSHGYDTKGSDGTWGMNTDTAFRKWQKEKGLTADGCCGPASWKMLLCGKT